MHRCLKKPIVIAVFHDQYFSFDLTDICRVVHQQCGRRVVSSSKVSDDEMHRLVKVDVVLNAGTV